MEVREPIKVFVGFDDREAAAYHVFCHSVIANASVPVALHPLSPRMFGDFDAQRDGSNTFLVSRYLVPALCDFSGWAIFADGDMVVTRDIAELLEYQDPSKAVAVVKHSYKTKHRLKYIGSEMECPNVDYDRKNWSSLVLWNCSHPSNARLTRKYVEEASSTHLHRFLWLEDSEIGEIPEDWNHLVDETPPGAPQLYHYTLGIPGIKHYADARGSWHWHQYLLGALECAGEDPVKMVKRSQDRVGC